MNNTAYRLGRNAGRLLLAPSLSPYPDGSGDAEQWELGWRSSVVEIMSLRDAQRRVKQGLVAEPCSEIGT